MAIRKPDLSLFIQAELDTANLKKVQEKALMSLQKDVVSRLASVSSSNIATAQTEIQHHLDTIVTSTRGSSRKIATILRDSFSTGFTGAIPSVEHLKKEVFNTSKEVINSIQRMNQDGFGKWFMNVSKFTLMTAGMIGVGMRAVSMFTGLAKGAFGLAEAAAKLEDAEKGFRMVAAQSTNASLALLQIRQAAGGVIDDMTLMGASTRAALSGLPVGKIPEIVESARALAAVTGRDVPDAIDRMVNAAAKQERKLLDELGIVVRANDLYEAYARKHDLVASAMSASQKQAAFLEGMLTAVRDKVQSLGGVLDDAQRPFLKFHEATRNASLSLGEAIKNSDFFMGSLHSLTSVIIEFGELFSKSQTKTVKAFSEYLHLQKQSENMETTAQERQLYALGAQQKLTEFTLTHIDAVKAQTIETNKAVAAYSDLKIATEDAQAPASGYYKVSLDTANILRSLGLSIKELSTVGGVGIADAPDSLKALRENAKNLVFELKKIQELGEPVADSIQDIRLSASELTNTISASIAREKKISLFLPFDTSKLGEIKRGISTVTTQIQEAQNEIVANRGFSQQGISGIFKLFEELAQAQASGDKQGAELIRNALDRRLFLMKMEDESFEKIQEIYVKKAKLEQDLADERQRILKQEQDDRLALIAEVNESELKPKSDLAKDQLAVMLESHAKGYKNEREIASKRVDITRLMVEESIAQIKRLDDVQQRINAGTVKAAKSLFDNQINLNKNQLSLGKEITLHEQREIVQSNLFALREHAARIARIQTIDNVSIESRLSANQEFQSAQTNLLEQTAAIDIKLKDAVKDTSKETHDAILRMSESTSEKEITNAWRVTQETLLAKRALLKEGTPEYIGVTLQLEALAIQSEGRIRAARILTATKTYSDLQGINSLAGIRNMQEELARRKASGEKVSQFEQALRNRNRAIIRSESQKFNEQVAKDEKDAAEKLANVMNNIRLKAEKNRFDKEKERIELQATEAIGLSRGNAEVLAQIETDKTKALAENEVNRTISNQKLLLSFKRIGIKDDIEAKKQQALDEKTLRDAQAEDEITDDAKKKEALTENEKAYQREILAINRAAFTERIKLYEQFAGSIVSIFDSISQAAGINNKRTVDALSKSISTISSAATAFATGGPAGILAGTATLVSGAVNIFTQASREAEAKLKQNQDNLSRYMEGMREQAVSVGKQIGDALTGGYELDFDKILQGFIKAQVAAGFAETFGVLLKEPLQDLRDSILAPQLGSEAFNRTFAEELTSATDDMKEHRKDIIALQTISGPLSEEDIRNMLGVPDTEETRAIIQDFAKGKNITDYDLRILASRKLQAEKRNKSGEQSIREMDAIIADSEPTMRAYVESAKRLAGDFSDTQSQLNEIIPTASFRAVTEPQANQMILLLSQQLAYLAQISTNTGVLPNMMNIMNGGRLGAAPLNAGLNANMGLENAQAMDFQQALDFKRQAAAAGMPA